MPYGNDHFALVVALMYLEGPRLIEMVNFLIENGANVNKRYLHFSALSQAILFKPDIVSYLLKNGAKVKEELDDNGNTSLMYALHDSWMLSRASCTDMVETRMLPESIVNKKVSQESAKRYEIELLHN
ncbi:hypothetical protein PoB_006935700 [Plakobranchus ocellatus]|uniref:Ankyrin repeat protein n=1 Tax=Plakobranchus ocellatus TaxID=259542 RepID=A0AAV4DF18_9GAST|nr:hypothetical protein PoB_006935700 [Plakobranchus ocellatus]